MAAVMSADLHNTDRLVTLKDDCRQLKITLQRPNINQSHYHFSVPDEQTILYGLGAIKGVGRAAVESLIVERDANGPFLNLVEFCQRMDHDKINRRALEAMVKSGAMDSFGESRRSMMQQVPEALKSADQEAKAAAAGQNDMFGIAAAPVAETQAKKPAQLAEWQERMLLSAEKEALGLYLTGHPFDAVRGDARYLADGRPSRRRRPVKVNATLRRPNARQPSPDSLWTCASEEIASASCLMTIRRVWKSAFSVRLFRNFAIYW
jgi:DNA polymerase-3 subunit alpha